MAQALLRMPEVLRRLSIGRTKFKEMLAAGTFPPPVRVDGNVLAWPDSDVLEFVNSRPRVGSGSTPQV